MEEVDSKSRHYRAQVLWSLLVAVVVAVVVLRQAKGHPIDASSASPQAQVFSVK